MKTPSPTKLTMAKSPRASPTREMPPAPASPAPADRSLAIMGHSMISRVGDPESEMNGMNLDLRLITGRMAQTLHTYEGSANSLARDNVKEVENHLDEIDNPILKVQIKNVLEDYKRVSIERENILYTLEKWFDGCADEFLEELEEFESQFEGQESLSDNINQAKDIIAKIKFINHKIVEFQNNGMSTQKLIAQKKTLEDELMKKKVIVDNVSSGSENNVQFRQRVDTLLVMIKESSASEIDRAMLDLKLSEAADEVCQQMVVLERNSRRVGVLFKNVKELEMTNTQLADENSFLKQRLSMVDKHFKETMNKKVRKLDASLNALGDIKYLKTNGRGSTTDDINRRVIKNSGLSMEMEMIENYQEQIAVLDRENRELIVRSETVEDECEELREEVTTLSTKLLKVISDEKKRRASEIAVDHPLVKLDNRSGTDIELPLSLSSSSSTGSGHQASGQAHERQRRGTLVVADRKKPSVISTITIQDGKELENLRKEIDYLKGQNVKLKRALTTAKRVNIRPRKVTRFTQVAMVVGPNGEQSFAPQSSTPQPVFEEVEPEGGEFEYSSGGESQSLPRTPGERPPPTPEKRKAPRQRAERRTPAMDVVKESSSSSEDEVEERSEGHRGSKKEGKDDTLPADVGPVVRKQEKEKRKLERRRRKSELQEKMANGKTALDVPEEMSSSSSDDEKDHDVATDGEEQGVENAPQPLEKREESKSIIKRDYAASKAPKQKKQVVTFQEPEEATESDDCPTFEKIPLPKVIGQDNSLSNLAKIKDELRDFLSYGQKFISSIHDCITDTTDDELSLRVKNYTTLEQKIISLEESMNILLYGVDLGMSLGGFSGSRPVYTPLPFENKLYFQENLSKYLREKYPTLNVSAIRIFDPDLDPVKSIADEPVEKSTSPTSRPYAGCRPDPDQGTLHLMMPLTKPPEPKPKMRRVPAQISKQKSQRKQVEEGKIEQIMEALTAFRKSDTKQEAPVLDERSFADIVDHIMPKEIALQYLKLVQPTQDTLGKVQYNEKLKRGVTKVKDLLDLVNINSNLGVMRGMPSNKLGEPRARQTRVHHTNLEMGTNLVGKQHFLPYHLHPRADGYGQYRHKLVRNDERVRVLLEDYSWHDDYDLKGSSTLTVGGAADGPLSSQRLRQGGRWAGSKPDTDPKMCTPKEEMFILSNSNPGSERGAPEKRPVLPMVTSNILPVVENNRKFPTRNLVTPRKGGQKASLVNTLLDHEPPRVSDILNLDWEKQTREVTKLPEINQVFEDQNFP